MRNIFLTAGVAALAIAMPASAKPGHGGGNGKGGGGHSAQVQRGGGGGGHAQRGGGGGGRSMKADRGPQMRSAQRAPRQQMERRGGGQQRAMKMERRGGGQQRAMRFAGFQERGHGKAQQRVENRGKRFEARGNGKSQMRQMQRVAERNQFRGRDRQEQRIKMRGNDNRVAEIRGRDRDRFENRFDNRDRNRFAEVRNTVRFGDRNRDFDRDDGRRWSRIFGDRVPAGFANGCPPGLAKKSPACVPPGQARGDNRYRNMAFVGAALPSIYSSNMLPLGLRDLYRDNDDYYYRYGDGYVYRVDRDDNLVNSLLPLIGAGYGIGQPFPYMNNSNYYVPSYYQPFYQDSPYYDYRYENGYVYQIDPYNGYIDNMIPLLDRGYGVGQMLPASYSYYNVPYQYRDLYYDTDDYYYRYAPGAIYQVDPQSRLITSVASLLSPGLSVGQALPMGYDVYNVPYAYRDNYYDTNDAWYRYANGNVYQVDPTTRLVTAIVASLLT